MVIQGAENTLSVTLDHIIYHTRCVSHVTKRSMIVGDLPFMSYQISAEQALTSAGRVIQEGGAHAIKLEGGSDMVPAIRKITRAGIPVIGHLGLTPQSVNAFGGFVIQGREPERARELKEDAIALQQAGVFCIVLEGIPSQLAAEITAQLQIPTIGIGAGIGCDGQVLVTHDMLGLNAGFVPSFVKQYAQIHTLLNQAIQSYISEVKTAQFPDDNHSFS
jgi:3-methyl-2-oxobutanoate hydroxymethyltransferase